MLSSRSRSRGKSVVVLPSNDSTQGENPELLPNPNPSILKRALEAVRAAPASLSRSRDRGAPAAPAPVTRPASAVRSPLIDKGIGSTSRTRPDDSPVGKGRVASRLIAQSSSKRRPQSKYSGAAVSRPGAKAKSDLSSLQSTSPIKAKPKQRVPGTRPSPGVRKTNSEPGKSKGVASNSSAKFSSKRGDGWTPKSISTRQPSEVYGGGLGGEKQRDAEKYGRRNMGATLEKAKQDWMARASILVATPAKYPVFATEARGGSRSAVAFENRHLEQGRQIEEDQRHSRKNMGNAMSKANQDWQRRQAKGDANITVPRGPSLGRSGSLTRGTNKNEPGAAVEEPPFTLRSFVVSVGLGEDLMLNLAALGVSSLEDLEAFCLGGSATVELGLLGLTEIEAVHLINKCRERAVFALPQQAGEAAGAAGTAPPRSRTTDRPLDRTSDAPTLKMSFASEQRIKARSMERRAQSEPRVSRLEKTSSSGENNTAAAAEEFGYIAPTWNSKTGHFERNAEGEVEAKRLAAEAIAERESRWVEPLVEEAKLEAAMRDTMADEGLHAKCAWESRRVNEELRTVAERPVFATEKKYPLVNVAWADRHVEQGQEIGRLKARGRENMGAAGVEAKKDWLTRQQGNLLHTVTDGPVFESEKKYPVKPVLHADRYVEQSRQIQLNEQHGRDASSAAGAKAKAAWEARNENGELATLAERPTFESETRYPIAAVSHADRHLEQGQQIQNDQYHGRRKMAAEANAARETWMARQQNDQLLTIGERPTFKSENKYPIAPVSFDDRYLEQEQQIQNDQYHGRRKMAVEANAARDMWEARQQSGQLKTIGERPKFETEKKYPIAPVSFDDRYLEQGQQIKHDQYHGRKNMAAEVNAARDLWEARQQSDQLLTIGERPYFESETRYPIKPVPHADRTRYEEQSWDIQSSEQHGRDVMSVAGTEAKAAWEARKDSAELTTLAERPQFETEKKYPIAAVSHTNHHLEQGEQIQHDQHHRRRKMSAEGIAARETWEARQQSSQLKTTGERPSFESEKKYPVKPVLHADRFVEQSRQIQSNEQHGRDASSAAGSNANAAWKARKDSDELTTLAERPQFKTEKKYPIAAISHADRHLEQGKKIQRDQNNGRKNMAAEGNVARETWVARQQSDQLRTSTERPNHGTSL